MCRCKVGGKEEEIVDFRAKVVLPNLHFSGATPINYQILYPRNGTLFGSLALAFPYARYRFKHLKIKVMPRNLSQDNTVICALIPPGVPPSSVSSQIYAMSFPHVVSTVSPA